MSAEIPDGAVIVARAIMNSSLWTMRPEDCKVAITFICLCNHADRKWYDGSKEILIRRGQCVRTIRKVAEAAHLPLQVVRTAVQHLVNSEFLTQHSTRYYTLWTLPKYDHYQDLTNYTDSVITAKPTQKPTHGQHTGNTRPTLNNNSKNYKNVKSAPGGAPPASSPFRKARRFGHLDRSVKERGAP